MTPAPPTAALGGLCLHNSSSPSSSLDTLPEALQQLILRTCLPLDDAVAAATACRRLRAAHLGTITTLTITNDPPSPRALLGLLARRPALTTLTVRGPAAALPALALAIAAGACSSSLRRLTLAYPSTSPPTPEAHRLLAAALGTGRLPQLETLRLEHTNDADDGLEEGGLELLRGLIDESPLLEPGRSGVPSPRWRALEAPVPLSTRDLALLAEVVEKRRRAGGVAVPSLPDGWWEGPVDVRSHLRTLVHSALLGALLGPEVQQEQLGAATAAATQAAADSLVWQAAGVGLWKDALEHGEALGSEAWPVVELLKAWGGFSAALKELGPTAAFPAITSIVAGDCESLLHALSLGRFPNVESLAFRGAPPLFAAEAVRGGTHSLGLERCEALRFTDIDFSDRKCYPVFCAIASLPRLRHLEIEGCTLHEASVVVFMEIIQGWAGTAPSDTVVVARMPALKAGLRRGRDGGCGATLESLRLRRCGLTPLCVTAIASALKRGAFPRLRALDLRDNAGCMADDIFTQMIAVSSSISSFCPTAPPPLAELRLEGTGLPNESISFLVECFADPPTAPRTFPNLTLLGLPADTITPAMQQRLVAAAAQHRPGLRVVFG